MKNLKLFGIIAIVALIGFTMTACEEDVGNNGVQKTLVITGITGLSGNITVAIANKKGNDFDLVAYNKVAYPANGADVTIPLISYVKAGEQFTGTGNFYILLYFDTNNTGTLTNNKTYGYAGGGLIPLTYSLTEAKTILAFSLFAEIL